MACHHIYLPTDSVDYLKKKWIDGCIIRKWLAWYHAPGKQINFPFSREMIYMVYNQNNTECTLSFGIIGSVYGNKSHEIINNTVPKFLNQEEKDFRKQSRKREKHPFYEHPILFSEINLYTFPTHLINPP